jgi:3',5'-cyclic AMP phosphodiesterase CpdA
MLLARLLAALLLTVLSTPLSLARSPSPTDPDRGDLRFVVFGDFNGPYGALEYPAAVHDVVSAIDCVWRPDLVLMPGDLVAGQSRSLPDDRFAHMWAVFDEDVASRLRSAGVPYAATMGNHDASSLRNRDGTFAFERERVAAAAYWSQPMYETNLAYVDRDDFPFRYAFRHGDAFVAIIDASSATVDDAARDWLTRVLRGPEATSATIRLVMGHLPLVGVSTKTAPGEEVTDGAALARLLRDLGVDTYVSGHHAAYYAGRWNGLELLFAGGIGGRPLLGSGARPPSAVTVTDVWLSPLRVRHTTFDPAGMQVIPGASLPERIPGDGPVERSPRALP